ncbi:MAG: diguanylate cyclase [Desulfuromonadaceae bacterium]|nr:diguanylate cyclase [Desulfuromonadaceae bacterium]
MLKTQKNKKILQLTGISLFLAMVALLGVFYSSLHLGVMEKAYDTVANLLQIQGAIRGYVQHVMRPEVYRLQQAGKLEYDYFSAELMSRSYVSSEVLKRYLDQSPHGVTGAVFRYASRSPLNFKNKATEREENLLQLFEQGTTGEYREVLTEDGQEVLFYAVPLGTFDTSCMRCHSDPVLAPPSLVERYGTDSGFHQQAGALSGLMSISIPLADYHREFKRSFGYVALATVLGFCLIFFFIYCLLSKKDAHDLLLVEKNRELDRLSSTDTLTGLCNRLRFDSEMDFLLQQTRQSQVPLAMLVLDLDHFKQVNDAFGHATGDQVLQYFASYLSSASRKSDFIARLGGEEFVVLVQGVEGEELVLYVQRLMQGLRDVRYPEGLRLTASIGVTLLRPQEDKKAFFSRADEAMYASKRNGRDCYTLLR